jgi:hypothetical protein
MPKQKDFLPRSTPWAEITEAMTVAAHDLFLQYGYYHTTIDDIAQASRVKVEHLIRTDRRRRYWLDEAIDLVTTNPHITETCARIMTLDDPDALLREAVHLNRQRFEAWFDFMQAIGALDPDDAADLDELGEMHGILREGTSLTGAHRRVARRLEQIDALNPGITAAQVTTAFWEHLNSCEFFHHIDGTGRSVDDVENLQFTKLRDLLLKPTSASCPQVDFGAAERG